MGSSSALNLLLIYPTLSTPAISLLFLSIFCFLCLFFFFFFTLSVCNNALVFVFHLSLDSFFCFYGATHHIDCLQPSMSSAGMCWWLTFIKTFMCASYAAITWRGCGWSKSICHMSIISARKFTGRFLWLAVYSTVAAFSKWSALLDKSWRDILILLLLNLTWAHLSGKDDSGSAEHADVTDWLSTDVTAE